MNGKPPESEEDLVGGLRITLPWPDNALWPNARPHWAEKMRAKQSYGGTAYTLAVDARNLAGWIAPGRATLHIQAIKHGRGVLPDSDNLLAALKCAIDSLRAAEVIYNDDPAHLVIGGINVERGPVSEVKLTVRETR